MTTRPLTLVRTGALVLSSLVLLAGCWTATDDSASSQTSPSAQASQPAATAEASAAEAPTSACDPGSASADPYECLGVTVAGASDEEPDVTLADDFAPATELAVADVVEGDGDTAQPGDTVTINYVGLGQQSREVFDSSWASGGTATFSLDQVIEGFGQGLLGMQEGGRRILVIPGSLGYGEAGSGTVIGPDETLVFVVDLVEVNPA